MTHDIGLKAKKTLAALLAKTDTIAAALTKAEKDRETIAAQIVGVHAEIADLEAHRPVQATTEADADADALLANPKAAASFLARFRAKPKGEGPLADWTAKRAALKAAARRGEDRVAELDGEIIGLRDQRESTVKDYRRAGDAAFSAAFMVAAKALDAELLRPWAAYGGSVNERVRMFEWVPTVNQITGEPSHPSYGQFSTNSDYHDPTREVALANFEAELRKIGA